MNEETYLFLYWLFKIPLPMFLRTWIMKWFWLLKNEGRPDLALHECKQVKKELEKQFEYEKTRAKWDKRRE